MPPAPDQTIRHLAHALRSARAERDAYRDETQVARDVYADRFGVPLLPESEDLSCGIERMSCQTDLNLWPRLTVLDF